MLIRGFPAQVLAFRSGHNLAVVDLNGTDVSASAPTMFYPWDLPLSLNAFEDPRLFVHRGELYVLAYGMAMNADPAGPTDGVGSQYLAKLERVSAAATANQTGPDAGADGRSGFRLVRPRRLLRPDVLLAGGWNLSTPRKEKNWVPFVHEDSIHIVYYLNPPVVLRLPDHELAGAGNDVRAELAAAGMLPVRWRYGEMRGGTPAVYDAALGGYIAFFHSHVQVKGDNPFSRGSFQRLYYMGCYVFAAQPPFSIQLISAAPILGLDFYNVSSPHRQIIWPAGLEVLPDEYIVSYGKNDRDIWMVRLDRREVIKALQAPLPAKWEGPPC